jgi:hypothetical protein
LAAGFAAAVSTSAFAGAPKGLVLSLDHQMVYAKPHAGGTALPGFAHPPASSVIYSNLASKYPKGVYLASSGYTLCGPSCEIGESISVAAAFTPAADVTAARVEAAVGFAAGTDSFTFAIYSDSNGVPGKSLWSGVAKTLYNFGDCCALDKVGIRGGLKLVGGKQYWFVAEADKKQADTFAAWNSSTTDQIDEAPTAFDDNGGGWQASTSTTPPAFAIYSK